MVIVVLSDKCVSCVDSRGDVHYSVCRQGRKICACVCDIVLEFHRCIVFVSIPWDYCMCDTTATTTSALYWPLHAEGQAIAVGFTAHHLYLTISLRRRFARLFWNNSSKFRRKLLFYFARVALENRIFILMSQFHWSISLAPATAPNK